MGHATHKSFNRGTTKKTMLALVPWTLTAATACLLALPWLWWLVAGAWNPFATPGLPAIPLPEGGWDLAGGAAALLSDAGTHGPYLVCCAAVTLACLVGWAAGVLRRWRTLHDGTWVGGARAPEATHGDAWLESRHSAVRRITYAWRGGKAPEGAGLVIGTLGHTERVLPFVNALLLGAPGSGKTRRVIIETVCGLAAAGRSVVVLDPKGEIRDFTAPYVRTCGHRVVDIRLDDPARSDRWDPLEPAKGAIEDGDAGLATAHLRELASIVVPQMTSANSYFSDCARSVLVGICLLVLRDPALTDAQRNLATVMALVGPGNGMSAAERVVALRERVDASDPAAPGLSAVGGTGNAAESVVSTLATALTDFVDARVSVMLHDDEAALDRVGEEPTVAYVSFSSATGHYNRLVTSLVSQVLASLRGSASTHGGALAVETFLVLEEFGQLTRLERLVRDAGIMRAEGIHLLIVLQDRHQVEAAGYSRAETDALLGMFDDTCLLKVNDVDTAGMVSRRLGYYTVRVEGSSTTKGHAGGTTGESVSTTRRELISPAELTQWTADTGLLLVTGGGAYAIPCPDLSERFEQGMLGMGKREENLATRRKATLAREPRNVAAPPIWDGNDVEGRLQGDGHEDVTEGFDPLA